MKRNVTFIGNSEMQHVHLTTEYDRPGGMMMIRMDGMS